MLFAAAAAKQLRTRDQVLAHARRLLDSPAGIATVRDLHDQMIKEVDPTELVRDAKLHPLFKPGIGVDMKEETLAFVNEVIFGQSKSVAELLTAPYIDGQRQAGARFTGCTVPGRHRRQVRQGRRSIPSSARASTPSWASWRRPPPTTTPGPSSAACT